jgi:hypothetical protein
VVIIIFENKIMIKYLLVLLTVLLTSCSHSTYQYKASCKVSNQLLFERITGVLVNEGLQIKTVTSNYLHAESAPESGQYGFINTHVWVISVLADTVTIKASTKKRLQDFERVYDDGDELKPENTWYWNVRKEVESICQSKIVVFESKK